MTDRHLDAARALSYAVGTLSPALAESIEAHLPSCPRCQQVLAVGVLQARLDAVLDAVLDRIDAPRSACSNAAWPGRG